MNLVALYETTLSLYEMQMVSKSLKRKKDSTIKQLPPTLRIPFPALRRSHRHRGKHFKSSGPPADGVGSNSEAREMKNSLSATTPDGWKSFPLCRQELRNARNEKTGKRATKTSNFVQLILRTA